MTSAVILLLRKKVEWLFKQVNPINFLLLQLVYLAMKLDEGLFRYVNSYVVDNN